MGREWTPSAVSGSNGRFTIPGVCVDGLKLTARKDGYESASREYSVSAGSSVSVVMYTLGECVVALYTITLLCYTNIVFRADIVYYECKEKLVTLLLVLQNNLSKQYQSNDM